MSTGTHRIVEGLEATLQSLYELVKHLQELRGQWLADHPRDEVDDAYTYGHNPPAVRSTRWDGKIKSVEITIGIVREELGFKRTALRGEVNRGEVCSICYEPEGDGHPLNGIDARGDNLVRFAAACRGKELAARESPRE